MANYYNLYQRATIEEVVKYTGNIYPGQLLSFGYGAKSTAPRIVLSIGMWEGKLHCLKLNEVNPNTLGKLFRAVVSSELIDRYEKSIKYGIYDEVLRKNEYQFPISMPVAGRDTTAEYFYRNVIKPSALLRSNNVYRTYTIAEIKNLRIVVPNLQLLGFLDKRIKQIPVTALKKSKFLSEGAALDKDINKPRFGKQDEEFD